MMQLLRMLTYEPDDRYYQRVQEVWTNSKGNPTETRVRCNGYGPGMKLGDFQRLKDSDQWLNDENLLCITEVLEQPSVIAELKIYVMQSQLVNQVFDDTKSGKVFEYLPVGNTKKDSNNVGRRLWEKLKQAGLTGSLKELECLLFPLNRNNTHWTMVGIFPNAVTQKICIGWFDSFDTKTIDKSVMFVIAKIICWYSFYQTDVTKVGHGLSDFQLGIFPNVPQQQLDGNSCGDHVLSKILQIVSNQLNKRVNHDIGHGLLNKYTPQNWNCWESVRSNDKAGYKRILKRSVM